MFTPQELLEGKIILINKPLRWTSHDVVAKLRSPIKRYCSDKKMKIGHAGTLDPLATGLLLLLTGKATKRTESLQGLDKEYTGTITLGANTPSYDAETAVSETFSLEGITAETIHAAAQQFIGEQEQMPPVYSSVQVNGIRAYNYAREGETVEIKTRTITLFKFEITDIRLPEVDFLVHCSKGTYIRSLAFDFGKVLGCGGYLTALCRTRVGEYLIEDAIEMETLLKGITVAKTDESL